MKTLKEPPQTIFDKQKGFALVWLTLILPVLLLASLYLYYLGRTSQVQNYFENFCRAQAIAAGAAEAIGLEQLGKLNPIALQLIEAEKTLKKLRLVGTLSPQTQVAIESAYKVVKTIEMHLLAAQQLVIKKTLLKTIEKLNEHSAYDSLLNRKNFSPFILFGAHALESALLLHVSVPPRFTKETAPPLELDRDFLKRQKLELIFVLAPQKFISPSMKRQAPDVVEIRCGAQVKMRSLEGPWSVDPL